MAFERTGDGPLLVIETRWARALVAELCAFCFLFGASLIFFLWAEVDQSAFHALSSCRAMTQQAEAVVLWDAAVLESLREDHPLPRFHSITKEPPTVTVMPASPFLQFPPSFPPPADTIPDGRGR